MTRLTRRKALKLGAASLLGAPMVIPSIVRGAAAPSNRLAVGIIGLGAMGTGHLHRMIGDPGATVLAVCDVDAVRREAGKATVESRYAAARSSGAYAGCDAYNDYREMLARRDIDAVINVTPDHWHTLISIEAAKAGKDVYCEKPISITIDEGRQLAQTMRRYHRIFQTGTQYRSIPTIRRVVQFVREGGLGKVKSVFALFDPLNWFIRQPRLAPWAKAFDPDRNGSSYAPLDFPLPEEPVPAGLDWNLWVGPAQWRPFNSAYHVNPSPGVVPWSFADGFGVASLTWHLSHSTDVIQYALGMEESGPVEIIHPSTKEFPTYTCRYANGTLLHLVEHWGIVRDVYKAVPADARLAGNFGGIFVGERGWVTSMTTGGAIEGGPEEMFQRMNLPTREVLHGGNNHHANWMECIRTRLRPSCDEEIGHRSASVGHLALIASKLGRSVKWDPAREEFPGDEAANRLRSRALREPWRF